jgi:hypothetical protein
MVSQGPFSAEGAPVPVAEIHIEDVGVNPLDGRRVDVAVDLTPCQQAVNVELVIVGPDDEELCSILLVQNRQWTLDKVMHLRRDAGPGDHILHVGVFFENELVTQAARRFRFPPHEVA